MLRNLKQSNGTQNGEFTLLTIHSYMCRLVLLHGGQEIGDQPESLLQAGIIRVAPGPPDEIYTAVAVTIKPLLLTATHKHFN
jgi:hypothetical protein